MLGNDVSSEHIDDQRAYEMEEIYRTLGAMHSASAVTLSNLAERVAELEERGSRLHSVVAELDERLGQMLSSITAGRTDLQNESHLVHLNLAEEYRSLIMQWMQRIARKLVGVKARSNFEYDLGRRVATFSEYLFRGAQPDIDGLLDSLNGAKGDATELAASMAKRAAGIRERIAGIGVAHEWDFRTELSGAIDESRQEAWLTCDPANPIAFVVAPAYVVQGVVYGKQLVATRPKQRP